LITPELKIKFKKALDGYKSVWKNEEKVFEELCFCLLTPQSSARGAMKTINLLKENGLLHNAEVGQIEEFVKNVRFYKTKST
jgi:N-glycosylase/DNA lyase